MDGPPLRTSTAIPLGVWPDRADGGLCRAPGKALPEVSGQHDGRIRRPTSASNRRLVDSLSHQEPEALVRGRAWTNSRVSRVTQVPGLQVNRGSTWLWIGA